MWKVKNCMYFALVWIIAASLTKVASGDGDRLRKAVEPTSKVPSTPTMAMDGEECSKCSGPLIYKSPKDVSVRIGGKATFRCYATGSPEPYFIWRKDNISVDASLHNNLSIKKLKEGSRLKIKAAGLEDQGLYQCVATNAFGKDDRVAKLKVTRFDVVKHSSDPQPSDTQNEEQIPFSTTSQMPSSVQSAGYCMQYKGRMCASEVDNKRSIYVSSHNEQSSIEKKLEIAFGVISKSNELSRKCKPYVLPLMCHYLFPYCEPNSNQPKPLALCYEECLTLQNDICRNEYLVAKREDIIGDVLLPDCQSLPKPDTPEGKKCINLGVRRTTPVSRAYHRGDVCFTGNGEDYRGNASITESGVVCQQWNTTSPHYHLFTATSSDFPELAGGHNYCRNPGGNRLRPWCFTTDPDVTFEYCNIQRCEEIPSIEVVSILYTVIPCLVFALALSAIIIFVAWHRQKQNLFRTNQPSIPLSTVVTRSPTKAPTEFLLESLHIIQALGEGEFGTIHYGVVTRMIDSQALKTYVTISRLRTDISSKAKATFLRNEATWSKFSHPNILCILGLFKRENPMCLLYQSVEEGNLHQYLRRHSPSDSADQEVLDFKELLSIATQIASGMVYLSSHNYIHGDLAARNCTVGTDQVIKIADFALTRVGYEHDYYRLAPDQPPIPVRWMSPEALFTGTLTVQSDIWSFGVVLWEIFSYGLQPHYGFSNAQVIDHLRQYEVLPCPCSCPVQLHALMKECWHQDPTMRKRFRELHKSLSTWRVYLEKGKVIT